MSATMELNMSALKRLWTKSLRFIEALEEMDDPTGHYLFSLGKRIDKLERDVEHLVAQQRTRAGGLIQQ